MGNRSVKVLLTVIAILLAANLLSPFLQTNAVQAQGRQCVGVAVDDKGEVL